MATAVSLATGTSDGARFAWTGRDIGIDTVTVKVERECADELVAFVSHLRTHTLPTILLSPQDYPLAATRRLAGRIKDLLDGSPGFCLVDRLPIDEMSEEEAKACYGLLATMVKRPVAQKRDGTMIDDVLDTGAKPLPGSGVRPDKSNADLTFHNDNAYNITMPEVVGLLCLRPAREGGLSRVLSFDTAYRVLNERAPEVLDRLHRDFWFDRQREHAPDEPTTYAAPILVTGKDGTKARLGLHQVKNAYAMRGESLDDEGEAAIAALEHVFADEALQFHFQMAAGQVQFVNNLAIGHSRTQFTDFDAPQKRRHLVRLWLRDVGDRSYAG